jgi:hypothetical protein
MTSEPVRELRAYAGFPAYAARRRSMGDALCVDVYPRMGMGALLAKSILFHEMAEQSGLKAEIISTNSLYLPAGSTDVLSEYFRGRSARTSATPLSGPSYIWALRRVAPQKLSLERASEIFAREFKPADAVSEVINTVLAGRQNFDLSIHFRGTDKALESGTPDIALALEHIAPFLEGSSGKDVFLATDDANFKNIIHTRYPHHNFTSFDMCEVPDGVPRHFSSMTPKEKAIESLVNIFLLSMSPMIVRSSSYMSAISAIANPSMKTITINKTLGERKIFPEHELIQSELSRG